MNISIREHVDREIQYATRGETYADDGGERRREEKAWRGPVTRLQELPRTTTREERDTRRPVIHLSRGVNHRATGSNRFDLPEADGSCVTVSLTYPSFLARERESADAWPNTHAVSRSRFFFYRDGKFPWVGLTVEREREEYLFPLMKVLRFHLLIESSAEEYFWI